MTRILAVDDSPSMRDMVRIALTGAGFNVMMENSNIRPFVEARFLNFFFEGNSSQSVHAMVGIKIAR